MVKIREANQLKENADYEAMWESGEVVKKKKRYKGSNEVWTTPEEDTDYPIGKVNFLPRQMGRRI